MLPIDMNNLILIRENNSLLFFFTAQHHATALTILTVFKSKTLFVLLYSHLRYITLRSHQTSRRYICYSVVSANQFFVQRAAQTLFSLEIVTNSIRLANSKLFVKQEL